ncbi:DUF2637 domain-containing protein [Nocardia sp. NPDC050435]|uniref:DUF2637 domain-containing protein n=1 Tax=Nocardia sp. NPDC050435 TaxID=3155040 RepID=UPI00340CE249
MNASTPTPVAAVSSPATGRWDFAEIVALAMTLVIGAGAFVWSFDALTGLAGMAGIRHQIAWIGPVFVDGAIIQSAVALVALHRRERALKEMGQHAEKIPTATWVFFWGELALAELVSVVGNGLHAAESGHRVLPALVAASVAGAAPVLGLVATHGLTALLEVPRPPQFVPTAGDSRTTPPDSTATASDAEATPQHGAEDTGDSEATPDRDAEILRLSQTGLSTRKIGDQVGLHHGTVAKILTRLRASDTGQQLALPAANNFRLIAGGTSEIEFTKE